MGSLEHLDLKPKGDDLSMLERLDMVRYGKKESKPTTPRTPPEKQPAEVRRSSVRGKKSESLAKKGASETPKEEKPEEPRVMVRAGGFQWIDRQAKGDALSQITEDIQQTPVTDTSRTSLRKSSTHRKSHGRDSPPRSGS